jgi:hypothetical protein
MEINVGKKTTFMKISMRPSPVKMIYQKLQNVEYFSYLGSIITNDVRCTHEIKSWTAMAKVAFKRKEDPITQNWTYNEGRNLNSTFAA